MLADDPDSIETITGPIQPCRKSNIRSAGYDLRLGSQYYLPNTTDEEDGFGGQLMVETLDPVKASTICIPANQVIIVSMVEHLALPDNVVGHLSLKLELLLKGLIMASQSQIDAGYTGKVFALLYNLSNEDVCISQGASILRMELATLTAATTKPYSGDFRNKSLAQSLLFRIRSGLYQMRQDINSAKSELTKTQLAGVIIAALFGVIPAFVTYFGLFENKVTKLEDSIELQSVQRKSDEEKQTFERVTEEKRLQDQIDSLRKEVDDLKKQKR
jgi:deoxycytidine triphosphate deaminase